MPDRRFELTADGYIEAKKWLQDNGHWDKSSSTGFSTDGFSIIEAANHIFRSELCNIKEARKD